jgi:hypothetical protein
MWPDSSLTKRFAHYESGVADRRELTPETEGQCSLAWHLYPGCCITLWEMDFPRHLMPGVGSPD